MSFLTVIGDIKVGLEMVEESKDLYTICMPYKELVFVFQSYTVKPVMRDHCNERLTSDERPFTKMALHFDTFVPTMKDHLSYKTTFCDPTEWSSSLYTIFFYKCWPKMGTLQVLATSYYSPPIIYHQLINDF